MVSCSQLTMSNWLSKESIRICLLSEVRADLFVWRIKKQRLILIVNSSLLSILLEAYIDVPPMYFPVPGHPLGNENILLSCPPPVLHNTWGGHDSRKFLVSCPPPVLSNTGGGHDSRNIFSIMSPPCIGQYRGGTWNWFILIN